MLVNYPAAPLRPSPISPSVDFDKEGVQHGLLRLPYSRDDSAWGSVMIPICVVKNGKGPVALLSGGNHGDEYEGPLALYDLANRLKPEDITGTVIIVPAMNFPAFQYGTRTSPVDYGNMNRIFPGRPDGTVTEKIADYFQRYLLPMADIVLDFHSGGRTLDFLPFCAAHVLEDKALEARAMAVVEAFGAPYSARMLELDAVGMYDTAAEEAGKVFVTTELGGGGSARASTVRIARAGVMNVLKHAGIVEGVPVPARTRWLDMPSVDCFSFAEDGGLYETVVDLGERVNEGDVIARVHPYNRTGRPAQELRAKLTGVLAARHFPGLIKPGDCASVVAVLKE